MPPAAPGKKAIDDAAVHKVSRGREDFARSAARFCYPSRENHLGSAGIDGRRASASWLTERRFIRQLVCERRTARMDGRAEQYRPAIDEGR
jgi:hypothetical protein